MQYANTTIIVLSIALLIAVGIATYMIGRIVCGIVRYYLYERKSERQFQHSEYGLLTSDGTFWTCEVHKYGRDIRIVVDGTEFAPSELLLAHVQTILVQFTELERRAIEYLYFSVAEIRDATLEFYLLESVDEQHPDSFTFEFINANDDSGVWRVEFVTGEPTRIGYDD